jgi:hypothetical protein
MKFDHVFATGVVAGLTILVLRIYAGSDELRASQYTEWYCSIITDEKGPLPAS